MYIIFINKFLLLKLASLKKPVACRGWRLFLQGFKGFNRLVVVLDGVDFLPSPLDGDAVGDGAKVGQVGFLKVADRWKGRPQYSSLTWWKWRLKTSRRRG